MIIACAFRQVLLVGVGFERFAATQPGGAAEELMRGLFGALRRQADATPSMGGFLKRVEQAAQRVAVADPALWSDPDHPWWQLLDRLLASGAVEEISEAAYRASLPQMPLPDRLDDDGSDDE
jgi:hypothetical protein